MSAIQQNVEATSASYSAAFTQGHLALPPAKKYLVLTCMDARIDPARAFGIELGDAHVIRNVSLCLEWGWGLSQSWRRRIKKARDCVLTDGD